MARTGRPSALFAPFEAAGGGWNGNQQKAVDGGRPFDWGRTSSDHAKFRDVYPPEFYQKIVGRNLCVCGQTVLDVGTGTGVLLRNLYPYGAKWVGTDRSERQIE